MSKSVFCCGRPSYGGCLTSPPYTNQMGPSNGRACENLSACVPANLVVLRMFRSLWRSSWLAWGEGLDDGPFKIARFVAAACCPRRLERSALRSWKVGANSQKPGMTLLAMTVLRRSDSVSVSKKCLDVYTLEGVIVEGRKRQSKGRVAKSLLRGASHLRSGPPANFKVDSRFPQLFAAQRRSPG